jgi:SpoVK/Ycf46/Vps4 family AAA+-type ATPase
VTSGYLLEKLPKSEVEDLTLEEVPDIGYADIGGLAAQIEAIRDAVELPYLYADSYKEHRLTPPKRVLFYGPRGCGKTITAMIAHTVDAMFDLSDENRFLEVTDAHGDKEVLYFKDFASGAMVESIVRRAKKLVLKRYIGGGEKGIITDDLLTAVREEFKESEDLPNTSNPDDGAKIAGKRGDRIVQAKPLMHEPSDTPRSADRVVTTRQYL